HIIFLGDGARLAIVAVGDEIHAPALFLEAPLHELSDGGIVFNDEDFHRGSIVQAMQRADIVSALSIVTFATAALQRRPISFPAAAPTSLVGSPAVWPAVWLAPRRS